MEHIVRVNVGVEVERGDTVICCTRYGNMMCSRESIIMLFIDRIRIGRTITMVNPDMMRFLMNLDEAVELVKFVFEHRGSGDFLSRRWI